MSIAHPCMLVLVRLPTTVGSVRAGWAHMTRSCCSPEIRENIRNLEGMDQDSDETDESAESDCYAIPDAAALNRILKYQALNDRRLQRTLTQLERLQRQRRGDYVPPPLKVSVDGSPGGE